MNIRSDKAKWFKNSLYLSKERNIHPHEVLGAIVVDFIQGQKAPFRGRDLKVAGTVLFQISKLKDLGLKTFSKSSPQQKKKPELSMGL